jgi:signal transduction histidine kinase
MDSFVEISLYRVVQELITNILNHATATRATIQIVRHASTCVLMVEDNGCGMDTETASRQGGIGLNNIRSRIDALSGSVHIDSTLGRGTTVTIEIPLANFAITSPEPR